MEFIGSEKYIYLSMKSSYRFIEHCKEKPEKKKNTKKKCNQGLGLGFVWNRIFFYNVALKSRSKEDLKESRRSKENRPHIFFENAHILMFFNIFCIFWPFFQKLIFHIFSTLAQFFIHILRNSLEEGNFLLYKS